MVKGSELLLDTSATTSFTDEMSSATGLDNLELVTSLSMSMGKHQNAAAISNSANDDILVASSAEDATGSFKANSALRTLTLLSSGSDSASSSGMTSSIASSTGLMSTSNMGEGNASHRKMKWAYSSFIMASVILGCI